MLSVVIASLTMIAFSAATAQRILARVASVKMVNITAANPALSDPTRFVTLFSAMRT